MIEQLIQNLTDALNRNTAALTGEPVVPGANAAPLTDAPKRPRGRPAKGEQTDPVEPVAAVPTQPAVATSPVAPPATAAAPVSPPAASASSVPFKDVADSLIALAEKSRDAAVALLSKFGATKAPELRVGDYAQFIAEARAQLAPQPAAATSSSGLL